MLVFLSKRIRLWLILAIGAPLVAWLLGFLGDRIEARSGPSGLTRALRKARGWIDRRAKGPLAHHEVTATEISNHK